MGAVSEITGECDKDHTHQIVIPALPGRYYRWKVLPRQTIEGVVEERGKSVPVGERRANTLLAHY
jgi:hypothetical protein